jgi:hypothetical protein
MTRNIISTLILLSCFACKDSAGTDFNARDASQIEGFWKGTSHPEWLYWFSNGHSEQRVIDFGQQITKIEYSYRTSQDTVFQTNIFTGQRRVWTTYFFTPDSVQITEPGALVLTLTLKRL